MKKKIYSLVVALFIAVGVLVSPVVAKSTYARDISVCLYQDTDRDGTKDAGENWISAYHVQMYTNWSYNGTNFPSTVNMPSYCSLWMFMPDTYNIGLTVKVPVYADNCVYFGGVEGNQVDIVILAGSSNQTRSFGWQPESGGSC